MWAAIAALFGVADNANKGAQAQYAMQRADYAQSIGYSQAKDLSFYKAYQTSTSTIAIIGLIGFLFLGFILYKLLK